MAQPRQYIQTNTFNDWTTTNPSDPHIGSKFDTEFTELKQNTDDLNTNIALLQRDDGKLKNEAVHKDAFDQDALALIGLKGYTVRGTWTAATAYVSGDIITFNDSTYLTSTDHTSASAFSSDTAKWTLLANAAINVTGHSVDTLNGLGTINLQSASWSINSAAITYTSTSGTPVVGQHITHSGFPTGTKIQSINTGTKVVTADTNSTAAGSGQTVDLSRGFTLTYSYGSSTDFQVYIANQLVSPSTYTVSGTTITFTTGPAAGTGNIIVWGGGVAVEATKAQVTSYRDDALDHRDTTIDYAVRTTGVVRLFDGATNNTSDTSPADQSNVYSAKEWAIGTQASTGGSAKDWAVKDDGGVSGSTSNHSAKAWAVGGTGVTNTANKGSAKDWAIKAEDSTVDGTNYSALHHATKGAASATAAASSATSAASSATAAATSETNAAASYDQFDDRYLGSKSSDPTQDNDGATLLDGALYFNTTNNVLMVYDLGNTTWRRTTPTTTDQGHINTVSGSIADVNRYAVEYKIAASAPGSPSEGHMWSDTTNNVFKVYNGTSWATVTEGQTEAEVNGTAISMAIALG